MVQFHLSGVPCKVEFSKLIVVSVYTSDVIVSTRDALNFTKVLNSCAISFLSYFNYGRVSIPELVFIKTKLSDKKMLIDRLWEPIAKSFLSANQSVFL